MRNLNKTPEQINRAIGQRLKKADRAIAKRYANTLNLIRKEIAKYYERYEQEGKLTYEEMARYDRLERLLQLMEVLLETNYKGVKDTVYNVLGESYRDGYYLTAWAVETDSRSKLAYSAVKPDTILKAIENPISGLKLNERLEKNRSEIVWRIQQEITQGLVKGETYGIMAKRLKSTLEQDTTKAMRVVRTEVHRVTEAAKHDSAYHATKNGVVMVKEWNTVQDERVRSSHKPLDGVKLPMDENFTSEFGNGPSPGELGSAREDINCRCFLTYSVEKIEKPDVKELENMTFEAWKKERLRGG